MLIHYKTLSLIAAITMTGMTLLAAAPALARPEPMVVTAQRTVDLPTQRVSYRDLNLAAAQDQRTLERRVGRAVKQVCRIEDYHASKSLRSYAIYLQCSDFAWGGARPQVAAAIDRAHALALNGSDAVAVGSLAITVSARPGA